MTDNQIHAFHWHLFLAPKHWASWIGFFLLWLLSRLPFDTQLSIGRLIGKLAWIALPGRKSVTLTNLGFAFPEKSEQQKLKLARQVYDHVGMTIAEEASLWFRPADFYLDRFDVHGTEHLDDALKLGRGVVLLQAHFSLIEINMAKLGPVYPISVVFDPPKNELFAAFLANRRARFLRSLVDNRQMRPMIRKLKQGEVVWYSPDQSVSLSRGGIETTFFGQPVLTTAGTGRIAGMTGAQVLPFVPTRHSDTGRYTIRIGEVLTFEGPDEKMATQKINDLFESQIRQQPEQYFWMHKRFKPPPGQGYKNPYSL
ncbi:lysophospholipid acyltransferase family protein [bacterium]|nr:lysophospholipid acyltransferase family protein [bacterium]